MITDVGDTRLGDFVDLGDPAARRRRERDEIFVAEGSPRSPGWWSPVTRSGRCSRCRGPRPQVRGLLAGRPRRGGAGGDARGGRSYRGLRPAPRRRGVGDAAAASSRRRGARDRRGGSPCSRVSNDPENLGLIARSARAFGIDALVLDPTCIDPYYRRTVRVSMGEVLLLHRRPLHRVADRHRHAARPRVRDVGVARRPPTPTTCGRACRPPKVALLFGAEGPGLRAATLRRAARRVRIPIDPASTRSTSATPRPMPSPPSAGDRGRRGYRGHPERGRGAIGSASPLQGGGCGFESHRLHGSSILAARTSRVATSGRG